MTASWVLDFLSGGGAAWHKFATRGASLVGHLAEASYQKLGAEDGQSSDDDASARKKDDLNALYYARGLTSCDPVRVCTAGKPSAQHLLTPKLRLFMPFQQLGWSHSWKGICKPKLILSGGHICSGNVDVFGAAAWSCETHHWHAAIWLWRTLIAFAIPFLLSLAVVTCNQFFGAAQASCCGSATAGCCSCVAVVVSVGGCLGQSRTCVASRNAAQVFLMMNSDLIVTYFLLHEQAACLSFSDLCRRHGHWFLVLFVFSPSLSLCPSLLPFSLPLSPLCQQ